MSDTPTHTDIMSDTPTYAPLVTLCIGVQPSESQMFTLAFWEHKWVMMSLWPFAHARCKAVLSERVRGCDVVCVGEGNVTEVAR